MRLRLRDRLPPTYPHVLAFALTMDLLTGPFPFSPLGLVHVANRIEQRRPLHADERLQLRVWAEGLRAHDRGRQFEVVAEASVDGSPVWRDGSTYLHREHGGSKGGERSDRRPPTRSGGCRVTSGGATRACLATITRSMRTR